MTGVVLLLGPGMTPASAAQNGRHIAVQFNLFGFMGGAGYNDAIAGDVINSLGTRSPKPLTSSFNEICWDQWDEIQQTSLPDSLGWVAVAHWSVNQPNLVCTHPGQRYTWYGNVVVGVRGPATTAANAAYVSQDPNPNRYEHRGAACLYNLANLSGYFDLTACTTHLYSGSRDITRAQLNELATGLNSFIHAGIPLMIMGDLNLRAVANPNDPQPDEAPLLNNWWYPLFGEGDRPSATVSPTRSTADFGKKYDYIFRQSPKTITDFAYIIDAKNSDHHWFEAYLT